MDAQRFDYLARVFGGTASRRRVLTGFALSPVAGLVTARRLDDVAAKKKHQKRKKRKPKTKQKAAAPNAFGCIDVGDLCQNATQCCSGICEGEQGKQTCRAHDVGDCAAGAQPEGCGGADVICTSSTGQEGVCATTTGNAGYCLFTADCFACQTDADCHTAFGGLLGPRAACVQCEFCADTGGTACAAPDFIDTMRGEDTQGAAIGAGLTMHQVEIHGSST